MTDMNMRANTSTNFPGRTYRFYAGKTLYEFGHGLSYSTFSTFIKSVPSTVLIQLTTASNTSNTLSATNSNTSWNNLSSGQAIDISTVNCKNLAFDLVIGVNNSGPRDGAHVVLVFWKPVSSGNESGAPNIQLVGFEKTEVKKGKTEFVTLKVDVCKRMSLVDSEGKWKLVTGQHMFLVGSPSEAQVRHYLNVKLAQSGNEEGFASF